MLTNNRFKSNRSEVIVKIQSLSVVVPNKACINSCKFCVSKCHEQSYPHTATALQIASRMRFARSNGCNTLMFTGTSEPQQNKEYLKIVAGLNRTLSDPFEIIEIQSTGAGITAEDLRMFAEDLQVSTFSLSLSSFDDSQNKYINGTSEKNRVQIVSFCQMVKDAGMNLRLSLNMTSAFSKLTVPEIFEYGCVALGADQLTFRKMYISDKKTPQNDWLAQHQYSDESLADIERYILENGRPLERLEFGAMKYSVHQTGVVLDTDCMNVEVSDTLKYVILRENGRLYSKWDDKGSLIY